VPALIAAPTAYAQTPPPSAVDQYVEMVPAAGGPKSPSKTEKKKRTPLPEEGRKALEKAPPEVAKPLDEISTSSSYGAPEVAEPRKPTEPRSNAPVRDPDIAPGTSVDSTLRGTATAIATASMDDARLIGLIVVLLVTTLGAVGLALRRPPRATPA
jgi:hypothetical protein